MQNYKIESKPQGAKEYVMTGSRDKTIISKIEEFGGVLEKNVTKKTHMVIAKDTTKESKTIKDAKKYNISVVSNDEFLAM